MRARCEGNWSPQTSQFSGSFGDGAIWQMVRSRGPLQRPGMTGYPTILHASAELPSVAGMVENRPFDMSVEMLSPGQQGKYVELTRGGTIRGQSCHKEHSMFRVSAPPKPQTPGPSRPAPPAPHEGRPG